MEVKVHTKFLELNSQAEAYISKQFTRLQRSLKSLDDAKLELKRVSSTTNQDKVVAQMTFNLNGKLLRAEEHAVNLFEAIDAAADVMEQQIQKYKTGIYRVPESLRTRKKQDGGRKNIRTDEPTVITRNPVDPSLPTVTRTKRFSITPMTVDTAIDEMELLGHKFFLFFNISTTEYNVVYCREDGNYGILEAELTKS